MRKKTCGGIQNCKREGRILREERIVKVKVGFLKNRIVKENGEFYGRKWNSKVIQRIVGKIASWRDWELWVTMENCTSRKL